MRNFLPGNTLVLGLLLFSLPGLPSAGAEVIQTSFAGPTLDRWFYPFNGEPGTKTLLSVFAALTEQGFDPSFDNRDGQVLVGFDTSAVVPAALGLDDYNVKLAVVRVTVGTDETFSYDPTSDPWQSWLPADDPGFVADPDPGRAVELFGAGFRNGWTASTFPETGPFCAACSCFPPNLCKEVRNVLAIDFAAGCVARDVSNNVDDAFDPVPFATGVNDALTPGQAVPVDTVLTFEIDVSDPCVQEYLRAAVDEGMLDLVVASIFPAEQQQSGTFPKLYARENILVDLGLVDAAQLDLTVVTGVIGDLNGDGIVGINDFLDMLTAWGACPEPCPPTCVADLNNDCIVNVVDLLILLANWG